LALVGDSADGIPGVPRWGAKSAAALLSTYGSLELIPDSAADWSVPVRGAAALAQSLAGLRTEAALYKRLATLRTDVPLVEDLAALEYRGARRAPLEQLARELSDDSLLERVTQFAS